MPLKEINAYIIKILDPNNSNPRIKEFIDGLSKEPEINSKRLIICIAIDIKNSLKITNSKNQKNNHYIQKLKGCIIRASDISITNKSFPANSINRIKFAHAQNEMNLGDKTPIISNEEINNEYARVYKFDAYMRWVVDINREYNIGIDKFYPDQIGRYYKAFKSKRQFSSVRISKLGRSNFIFVAKKDQLENIGYNNTKNLIDSLGLYIQNIQEGDGFVCMEYPNNFFEKTWQPDIFTGDWGRINDDLWTEGNEFFLSFYNKDGYGRTYSISSKGESLKERVHRPFDHNGREIYKMNTENLSELSTQISKGDEFSLLKEALKRFYAL